MQRFFTLSLMILACLFCNIDTSSAQIIDQQSDQKENFFEGFETWPSEGWITYSAGGDGWIQSADGPFEGSNQMSRISENRDCNDWLISPKITVPESGYIQFYQKNKYVPTYYELHEVCISKGSSDPSQGDFATLTSLDTEQENWGKVELSLADYIGEEVYIAFHYKGEFTSDWHIDALSVYEKHNHDIKLAEINMKDVAFGGQNITPQLRVINVGIQDETSIEVNINIGASIFSKSIDLDAGEETIVSFDEMTFTEEMVVEASIVLAGDENTANNNKQKTIRKLIDGSAYGFSIYSDEGTIDDGPVKFNLSSPGSINRINNLDIGHLQAFAGTMINNLWFCSIHDRVLVNKDEVKTRDRKGVLEVPLYLCLIDMESGLFYPVVANDLKFKAMSYNQTDGLVYAMMEENKVQQLYAINYKTGEINHIHAAEYGQPYLVNIAIDASGKAYGIAENQFLYEINLEDFSLTAIGSTGAGEVSYAQSLAFDYTNNTLYWSMCNSNSGVFYEVNTTTGKASLIDIFQANAEITSLGIPFGEDKYYANFNVKNEDNTPLQGLNVKVDGRTLSTYASGDACFADLQKDETYTYEVSTADGNVVKSGSFTLEASKTIALTLEGITFTDLAVEDMIAPEFQFAGKDIKVSATISNKGYGDIGVAQVTLTAGSYTDTKNISINQNEAEEVVFSGISISTDTEVEIKVEHSQDQISSNNSLSSTIKSVDSKKMYGYCIYSTEDNIPSGPVHFDNSTPDNIESMGHIAVDNIMPRCGVMIHNLWFVCNEFYIEDKGNAKSAKVVEPVNFALIDKETGRALNVTPTDQLFELMSYDYKNEKLYGIILEEGVFNLYTIDYKTGSTTLVKNGQATDPVLVSFAIDTEGNAYGISKNKYLYSINLETFAFTAIGHTGVSEVDYQQSMCFDHETGILLWALCNSGDGEFRAVNTTTGASTLIEMLDESAELVGLGIPYGEEEYYAGFYLYNKNIDNAEEGVEVSQSVPAISQTTDKYGTCVFFDLEKDQEYTYNIKKEDGTEFGYRHTVENCNVINIDTDGVGVEEVLADKIGIYPNPAANNITIMNLEEAEWVKIIDMQLKCVKMIKQPTSGSIDIADLKAGVYTIQLNSNGKIYTEKLLKK